MTIRNFYSENELIMSEVHAFIETAEETTGRNKRDDLSYRVKRKITEILRRERTMIDSYALEISSEQLWDIYRGYSALISWINELVVYTPDKMEFCAYARISTTAYNALLIDGNEEIKQTIGDIDNDLLNATLNGAEAGISKEGITKFRAKGKGFGHSAVETDSMDNAIQLNNSDLMAKAIEQELRRAIAPPIK